MKKKRERERKKVSDRESEKEKNGTENDFYSWRYLRKKGEREREKGDIEKENV